MAILKSLRQRIFPQTAERGQSLIILAFSFVGLIGMLGLALDLGLVYVERTNLKRALDAAVLSGVVELPVEESAILRSMGYLGLNGYPLEESDVVVTGCVRDVKDYYDFDTYCGSEGCGRDNDPSQLVNVKGDDPPYPYREIEDARHRFHIDTANFQDDNARCSTDTDSTGTATHVQITGTTTVDMNFMQFLGFSEVPVTDSAIAQNIDRLDVAVVIDRSGSMELDPVCHGCWELNASPDPDDNPRYSSYTDYPASGNIYPYAYDYEGVVYDLTDDSIMDHPLIASACTQPANNSQARDTVYESNSNHRYMVLEAELYNYTNVAPNAELAASGKGYWAFQRGYGNYGGNNPPLASAGTSVDSRGAHMAYYPTRPFGPSTDNNNDGLCDFPNDPDLCKPHGLHIEYNDAQNGDAPVLQYNFKFHQAAGWGSTAYLWARVHPSRGMDANSNRWETLYDRGDNTGDISNAYYALVSAECVGGGNNCDPGADPRGTSIIDLRHSAGDVQIAPRASIPMDGYDKTYAQPNPPTPANNVQPYPQSLQPRQDGYWRWVKLAEINIDYDEYYRLHFYAGSTGYGVDRFLITDNPSAASSSLNDHSDEGFSEGLGYPLVDYDGNDVRIVPHGWNYDQAPPPNMGSAFGIACDQCNPIYGKNITDPSVCTFNNLSGPTNMAVTSPLFEDWESPLRPTKEAVKQFVRRLNPERDQVGFASYDSNNEPDSIVQLQCQERWDNSCLDISNPYSYTEVLKGVEDLHASGGTNTAAGMKAGLEILGFNPYNDSDKNNACNPNDPEDSSCARSTARKVLVVITDGNPNANPGGSCRNGTYWTGSTAGSGNQEDYDCPLWFAEWAAQNGVNVYAIGVGFGVDENFVREIGRYGNGKGFLSVNPAELNLIFSEILENITVRLVQ